MESYRVSLIGDRTLIKGGAWETDIAAILRSCIAAKEHVTFYVGRESEFDKAAAAAVKQMQTAFGKENSMLILVLPYRIKEEGHYRSDYDDIYCPFPSQDCRRFAITRRNQWMVEHSDLLLTYVRDEQGEAHHAMVHASYKGVPIINIAAKKADM